MNEYKNGYLKSEHWKLFRVKALKHYGNKCSQCGSADNLHVHHLNYNSLNSETFDDVCILCKLCHSDYHGIKKERCWTNKLTGEKIYLQDNKELVSQCRKEGHSWNACLNIMLGHISDSAIILYLQLRTLSYNLKYRVPKYLGCAIKINSSQISQETKRSKSLVLKCLAELTKSNILCHDRLNRYSYYLFINYRDWGIAA